MSSFKKETWFQKLKKRLKSSILCIRFPFLYPRNRFTDTHYVNWKIWDKIREIRSLGCSCFSVITKSENEIVKTNNEKITKFFTLIEQCSFSDKIVIGRTELVVGIDNNDLVLCCNKNIIKRISLKKWGENRSFSKALFQILYKKQGINGVKPNETLTYKIVLVETEKNENKKDPFVSEFIIFDKWQIYKSNLLKFYHNTILQLFHCIPSSTELDEMPYGWRKKFGIQMCKEIRHELIRCGFKNLFTYRIAQIKEKFATLRWYDNYEPNGSKIFEIISKYEDLSYHTCINCGKDAHWISKGWISPYCDDCATDKDKFTILKK